MNITTGSPKVILADENEIWRLAIKELIKQFGSLECVAETSFESELYALSIQHQPGFIILDPSILSNPLVDFIQRLRSNNKNSYIMVVTDQIEESMIAEALNAGVSAYLTKKASRKELLEGIEAALRYKPYYCALTSQKMCHYIENENKSLHNPVKRNFSRRELEIIDLICKGNSNKEIANILQLSVRTIEEHRKKIHRKMNVHNAVGVLRFAFQSGLIRL
jgi:DNA-binding NarL/FixJ family response regulator